MRRGRRAGFTRGIVGLVAIVLLGFVSPATAQEGDAKAEENPYAARGAYLSLAARYQLPTERGRIAREVEADLGVPAGASTDVDDSVGVDVRLGYRLHPRFALEGQFEWVSNIEVDTHSPGLQKMTSEQRLIVVGANGKLYLLQGRVQPYLIGGAAWGRSTLELSGSGPNGPQRDRRENGLLLRAGVGADLYGSRDVALTVEAAYVIGRGPLEQLDHLTMGVGLTLRFFGD